MRLAFLMQDTGAVYGAEQATLDVVAGLAARGVEVRILLIEERRIARAANPLRDALTARGLAWQALPVDRPLSLQLVRGLRSVLRAGSFDVLHTVGYKANVHGAWAVRAGTCPQVATVHGWLFRRDLKERFYGWVDLWSLRRCRAVVALSKHYEAWLRERGVAAVRIPSGLPWEAMPPAPDWPAGPFTVGLLGRLSEEKNHAMLLRVAQRLRDTPVRFLVAGDGPLREPLQEAAARLGVQGQVEWAGYLDRAAFFARAHVLVLCSWIENLPYSVMEAMAWQRPVVATRVGGLPDLVEDGRSGALVDYDDDEAMARVLRGWAGDPAQAQTAGRAGREKLEREFGLDACVQRHLELYRSVCAGGAS